MSMTIMENGYENSLEKVVQVTFGSTGIIHAYRFQNTQYFALDIKITLDHLSTLVSDPIIHISFLLLPFHVLSNKSCSFVQAY